MKWQTIHTVTYPSEAHVIKLQLETEGFEVFLKDELTIQVDNFYSNAIGGVKIQVLTEEAESAFEFIKELGYVVNSESKISLLDSIYLFTEKIPFVNKLIPEIRLLSMVGAILLLVLIPVFYYQPSLKSQLNESEWCIKRIYYLGEEFEPNTESNFTEIYGHCNESMEFQNDLLLLPGINSPRVSSEFSISKNILSISNSDSFDFVWDGDYVVEINDNLIVFTSEKTQIVGYLHGTHYTEAFNWNF